MKQVGKIIFAVAITIVSGASARDAALEKEDPHELFAHPPRAARLQTFWHWVSDGLTREGIVRDLDAMAEADIATAHVYCPHMGTGGLPYNVPMMSEKWLALFAFAIAEAKNRDITLGFHNCPGWSSSGGPWIGPEDSMKEVVVSDSAFESDGHAPVPTLPQPRANKNFYRDIAVWAIPVRPLPNAAFAHAEGTVPEIFDAAKGTITPAREVNGRVTLDLPSESSVFVVFTRERDCPNRVISESQHEAVLATLSDGWRITSFTGPGAPQPFAIDKLTSWTESSDPQLKYFSGRAVYEKKVEKRGGGGEGYILDLGEVREIANVWIDDTYVGCVWEPPYRIDITSALPSTLNLQPSTFNLKIEVVNTWPNRMIGDAVARKNGAKEERDPLTKLPLWVRDGKADSGTGIYTWSNFDWGWKAEDALKPSGLLGPVRIVPKDGEGRVCRMLNLKRRMK